MKTNILLFLCTVTALLVSVHTIESRAAVQNLYMRDSVAVLRDSLQALDVTRKQDSVKEELRILLDLVCENRKLPERWKTRLACKSSETS